MGELYQYDPYDTEASLWNSYPWQLGADNGLDFEAVIPAFTMAKTIWTIGGSDSSIGSSSAELANFSMYAALILIDNFGNFGEDIGTKPAVIPYATVGISGGVISRVTTLEIPSDITIDSYSERQDEPVPSVSISGGNITDVLSRLAYIEIDSYSERLDEPVPSVSISGGNITTISSVFRG